MIPALPVDIGYEVVSTAGSTMWVGSALEHALLRFDGTRWTGLVEQFSPIDLAATGNEVWVLEASNRITHFDGTSFIDVVVPSTFPLRRIAAQGNEVWAVGDNGAVVRWNGSAFASVTTGIDPSTHVLSLSLSSPSDVWLGCSDSTVRHFDGTTWLSRPAPAPVTAVWAMADGGFDDAGTLVVGPNMSIWNGSTWRSASGAPSEVIEIVGTRPDSLFAVRTPSSLGELYYFNGTSFSRPSQGVEDSRDVALWQSGWVSVGLFSNLTVSAPEQEVTAHMLPLMSRTPLVPSPAVPGFTRVVSLGANDALIFTSSSAFRGDPTTGVFTSAPQFVPPGLTPSAFLAAPAANDVWFDSGNGVVRHYDGTMWTSIVVSPGATALRLVSSGGSTWAVNGANVYRFDGGVFSPDTSLPAAADTFSKFATGSAGDLWLWTGGTHQTFSHLIPGGAWSTLTDASPGRSSASLRVDGTQLWSLSVSGRQVVGTSLQDAPATTPPPNTSGVMFQGTESANWAWLVISRVGVMSEYRMRNACGSDRWELMPPLATSYNSIFTTAEDGTALRSAQSASGSTRNLLRYVGP
ncbi:MAG: hypothetical protein QM817_19035 [Archangium sp.]